MADGYREITAADRVAAGPGFYVDPVPAGPEVTFTEGFKQGFLDQNSIASWYEDYKYQTESPEQTGFNPYERVPQEMQHLPSSVWRGVRSEEEMDSRIAKLQVEQRRQELLGESGWGGFFGQFFGAMGSPEFWPLMVAAPFGMGGSVSSTALRMGIATGAEEALHETALHQGQYLRTKEQSLVNTGIATLFGAGIGIPLGILGKRAATAMQKDVDAFRQSVLDELNEVATNKGLVDMNRSVSAAATYSYEGERIVNPPWIEWFRMGPMRPLAHTQDVESARLLNQTWEHSYTLGKNEWGEASQPALETIVEREVASMVANANRSVHTGYKNYLKEIDQAGATAAISRGMNRTWDDYQKRLHLALVRGDIDDNSTAITNTAKFLRQNVFDKTLKVAQDVGFINAEEFATNFAKSYAPRRWNKRVVRANSGAFTTYLRERYLKDHQETRFKAAVEKQEAAIAKARERLESFEGQYKKKQEKLVAKIERLEAEKASLKNKAAIKARNQEIARAKRSLATSQKTLLEGKMATKLRQDVQQTEEALKGITPEQFKFVENWDGNVRRPDEIDTYVQATFRRITERFDDDVYMAPDHMGKGSPYKERKVPLEDEFLIQQGWLHSDVEAMMMNHVNTMLKPARMHQFHGDAEMNTALKRVEESYTAKIMELRTAGKNAEADKLDKRMIREIDAHKSIRDRWYGRNTVASNRAEQQVNDFLRAIRNLNTSIMMGMVTLTSAGDIARWNLATIFAPELKRAGPGMLKAFQTMRLNRAELQRIGVAHEVATMIRNARLMDSAGNLETESLVVGATGKVAQSLMRSTLLNRWTDFGKLMAASYTQNDLIQKAMGFARLSAKSKARLARIGVDEELANVIQREVRRGLSLPEEERSIARIGMKDAGYDAAATVVRFDNWENPEAAQRFADIIFRESERALVSPRAGDIPQPIGRGEIEKSVMQFMSFSFAAVNQIGVPIGMRLRQFDPKAYALLGQMIVGGMIAALLRESVKGEEGLNRINSWSSTDWLLRGIDLSGAVPLFMMGFNQINAATDNKLTQWMGANSMNMSMHRPMDKLAGPTWATIDRGIRLGYGLSDGVDGSDVRIMRRLAPFNNHMLLIKGANDVENYLVEKAEQ